MPKILKTWPVALTLMRHPTLKMDATSKTSTWARARTTADTTGMMPDTNTTTKQFMDTITILDTTTITAAMAIMFIVEMIMATITTMNLTTMTVRSVPLWKPLNDGAVRVMKKFVKSNAHGHLSHDDYF